MMKRRALLKWLLGIAGMLLLRPAKTALYTGKAGRSNQGRGQLLLRDCELDGFHLYRGLAAWPRMKHGDPLTLVRAPLRHAPDRVEVGWHDDIIGHLPQRAATTISLLLDRKEPLYGILSALKESHYPWERAAIEVWRSSTTDVPRPRSRYNRHMTEDDERLHCHWVESLHSPAFQMHGQGSETPPRVLAAVMSHDGRWHYRPGVWHRAPTCWQEGNGYASAEEAMKAVEQAFAEAGLIWLSKESALHQPAKPQSPLVLPGQRG